MRPIGRRQFCAVLGAGLAGFSVVLIAGCSSPDGQAVPADATAGASSDAAIAGVSVEVRRDPG
jgi:hypothetical protein